MLLATVTAATEVKEGTDFLPLQVDYREKYYAAGRFPGGFLKRESRPDDYEILISRLVDRPIRPLWPEDFHLEVFVNVMLISAEKDIQPDALAGLAASAALATSDLPFQGPISEVRVCRIDGQFVINPTFKEMERADLELMVAATEENIMMVEGEMQEVSEHDMLEAIKFAHEEIKKHCRIQKELMHELGTDVNKRDYPHDVEDEDLKKAVREACYNRCYETAKAALPKHERADAFEAVKADFLATIPEEELEEKTPLVERYYHDVEKEAMRNLVLDEGRRLDGRATDEVRPIWCEVDYLPCAHGSAIFTRGETQSLATVTLGTKLDMKEQDEVLIQGDQQFVLHFRRGIAGKECVEPDTIDILHDNTGTQRLVDFFGVSLHDGGMVELHHQRILFLQQFKIDSLVKVSRFQSFEHKPPALALDFHQSAEATAGHIFIDVEDVVFRKELPADRTGCTVVVHGRIVL